MGGVPRHAQRLRTTHRHCSFFLPEYWNPKANPARVCAFCYFVRLDLLRSVTAAGQDAQKTHRKKSEAETVSRSGS